MFDVMTITRKGLELLAQATAANKLVIVGCDATADFTDAATAATTSARPANPLASTTEVTILSASNTSVFTRAAFIAGTSTGGGQAKSFFLYGHSANDTAHDYVICVASNNESVHIPLPGELINTYGLEFETVYSGAGDTVTVTGTANYCTLAEFNVLKERTVTTHKEGDNTAGDNQTIRGEKTFVGRIAVTDMSQNKFSAINYDAIYYGESGYDLAGMKVNVATAYGIASLKMIAGDVLDPDNHTMLWIRHSNNNDSYNGFYFFINSEGESVASISYNDDLSDYEFYATNVGADNLRLANSFSLTGSIEKTSSNPLAIICKTSDNSHTSSLYLNQPLSGAYSAVLYAEAVRFSLTNGKSVIFGSDADFGAMPIKGLVKSLYANDVGGFYVLLVNLIDGVDGDGFSRGDEIYTGKSVGTGTINILCIEGPGEPGLKPSTYKYRSLQTVAFYQGSTTYSVTVFAILEEY